MNNFKQLEMIRNSVRMETDDINIINDIVSKSAWELFKGSWRGWWWDLSRFLKG